MIDRFKRTVLSNLVLVLDRYDQNKGLPFIDTKFRTIDGTDFDPSDPVRGTGVVYSWIQGRGLEALAGHYNWLRNADDVDATLKEELCGKILRVLGEVMDRMEALRAANGGRLFFMMSRSGQPLRMGSGGIPVPTEIEPGAPSNFSDIFYSKGLAAAASVLGNKEKLNEACDWFLQIDQDLCSDRFQSDQQPLDPRNAAVKQVPGRFSHGPRMIAIGAAARFLECTKDVAFFGLGLNYIDHILKFHVNVGETESKTRPYDLWEFIDSDRRPFFDESGLLSDPGHACEFVGLALKLLRIAEGIKPGAGLPEEVLSGIREKLFHVLRQNFRTGFSPRGYGIFKAVDLLSRKPLNTDMPWWSLPETIRAAFEAGRTANAARKEELLRMVEACSNAFFGRYVQPELHDIAVQTLNGEGAPADVIPATPDADPCYHTGLSLIDCLSY